MSDDPKTGKTSAYAAAGVDIDAQEAGLSRVKELARSTFTSGVLSEIGSFGGLFRPDFAGMQEPVLVASADGVGTKLRVAQLMDDLSTVGADLVNHCVNDILVQGARPLFFLDYVGAGVLEPEKLAELVEGVAAACKANGCALLGGETAEMPGFYRQGDYELVGTIVGMVDRPALLDGSRVRVGDRLLGLPSSGLHTNGYSLARRVFFEVLGLGVNETVPGAEDRRTVGEMLMATHLSYLRQIEPLLGLPALHALAHITGGGLTDNLPRVLPGGSGACVRDGAWEVPELFELIARHGEIERDEMYRVFNMGVGMVLVVSAEGAEEIKARLAEQGEAPCELGFIEEGDGEVRYEPA